MLNLAPLYVEHLFTIRNTVQYGASGIKRGDRSATRIQRVFAEPASRTHPTSAIARTSARRSARVSSQRSKTQLSQTIPGYNDRVDDCTARLVRRPAQPDDWSSRRRRTRREDAQLRRA